MTATRGNIIIYSVLGVVLVLMVAIFYHKDRVIQVVAGQPEVIKMAAPSQALQPIIAVTQKPSSKISIVDLKAPITDTGECVKSKTNPVYTLCIHDANVDKTVSMFFKRDGSWEGVYLPTFQDILKSDPELGFIDVGANIGPWGILAATMGHKTLMVEPFPNHIEKIRRSIQIGNLQDKIILVQNSVSDQYANYSALFPYGSSNLGALRMIPYTGKGVRMTSVYMDDLLEVMPFNRALMKLDLEGFEDKALKHSEKVFQKIFIPYVIMEWAFPKYVFGNDKARVMALIKTMTDKGYMPYAYGWKPLQFNNWPNWPLDIIWRHNLFKPIP